MLFLFNSTTQTFVARAKAMAFKILGQELNLPLGRERFLWKNRWVPLQVIIFEGSSKWGFYDSSLFQIGLNKNLFWQAQDSIIEQIIRHELAHMLTHLVYGPDVMAHGVEFKQICRHYFFQEDISKASLNLQQVQEVTTQEEDFEKLQSKLKKLLSLAQSSNIHESQLATAKANQLLIDYNRQKLLDTPWDESTTYVKRVIDGKRCGGKERAIYSILKLFLVCPVFNHGPGHFYLEVVGDKGNVEFAHYVADFLNLELERLWALALKDYRSNPDKGGRANKNSFMSGVAAGYEEKIKQASSNTSDLQNENNQKKALVAIDKRLAMHLKRVHPRLGHSRSTSYLDQGWLNQGKKAGQKLSINRPLNSSSRSTTLLLS